MDKLIRVETGIQVRQDETDLVGVNWTPKVLSLDFETGHQLIRVQFSGALAYRVVDEVLDSIDGEGVRDGANRSGFAYEVENGAFLASYPNVNLYHPHPSGPLRQYALISLNWCVEVLAHVPPTFCSVG
jgi:hypothetical protein